MQESNRDCTDTVGSDVELELESREFVFKLVLEFVFELVLEFVFELVLELECAEVAMASFPFVVGAVKSMTN